LANPQTAWNFLLLDQAKPIRKATRAQYNLGVMYKQGLGVPQDDAEAVKWWRLAADQKLAAAQSNLGTMYDSGRGVEQDYGQALKWYRLAADQGEAFAQYNLGLMYGKGEGVPQDYVLAHIWMNLSAIKGDQKAIEAREKVALAMTPAQIAEAQKLARDWKPNK
jgi:TPR repeat protein